MSQPCQRTVKTLRKCRACQGCRKRKIKCDGQQPNCTACMQQQDLCKYTEDKRQTSRVSKEAVDSITYKVTYLEDVVRRLKSANPPRVSRDGSSTRASSPVPSSRLSTPPVLEDTDKVPAFPPVSFSTTLATPRAPASIENHSGNENDAVSRAEYAALTDLTCTQQEACLRPPSLTSDQHGKAAIFFRHHMRVSNTVHGPTSTFHPQSFPPASFKESNATIAQAHKSTTSQRGISSLQNNDEQQSTRAQLFTYAALERQKEFGYRLKQRFDFDGIDYDTALHLLELHWNHQHCAYLWSYRPAIMNSLATGGPYTSKLLLNALFYSAALNSDRETREPTGEKFLARFQSLLLPELEKSSIPSVLALLQLGSSLVAHGRQTAGWLYSGLAYRMIIDLGLHLDPGIVQTCSSPSDPQSKLSSVDFEVQRRLFWGAYVNDKFQSLYFGRPPVLSLSGLEPPLEYLDAYEELELWSPYIDPQSPHVAITSFTPKPAYAISTFTWLVKLATIATEITEQLYIPSTTVMSVETALDHLDRLQGKLDDWQEQLPPHLHYDPKNDSPPPMHQFNIHTTHHTLVILLHRPFLPDGYLRHIGLEDSATRERCVSAALNIYGLAKAYRDTFTLRRAPYLFSYALFSAMTVIPHHNTLGWNSVAHTEMLVFFWNALKELQQGSNFGLRKPIKIIRDFLARAGVDTDAFASRTDLGQQTVSAAAPCNNPDGDAYDVGAGMSGPMDTGIENYAEMFPGLYTDDYGWLEGSNNFDTSLNDDTLYGLFRST